ncbi:MAG: hypothetical protein LBO06_04230 [Bacteroidales bacterium]|jgi:hypothetical protein|nr:hypothetical protein [Bacteroidales bacterium]
MKRIALIVILFAAAFAFGSCSESHDCQCSVNGQIESFYDQDTPCEDLENNYPQSKDLPGSGGSTGIYCTEI